MQSNTAAISLPDIREKDEAMAFNYPLVSIVVRTHNRAESLRDALNCLFNQTYGNLEIWVIDHNSTDNTREVVQSFGSRVNYFFHRGQFYETFNVWRPLVKGEFIGFLDDDDYIKPECIEKLAAILTTEREVDVVFGRQRYFLCDDTCCRILSETELLLPDQIRKNLLRSNVILWNAVLIRRRALAKLPLIGEDITGSFDWRFWIYAALANLAFYQIPEILGFIQISRDSVQRQMIRMSTGDIECVRYYGSRLSLKKKLSFGYFYCYGIRLIRYGIICMEHGFVKTGRKSVLKGLICLTLSPKGKSKWLISALVLFVSLISDEKQARYRCERLLGCSIFRNYYESVN